MAINFSLQRKIIINGKSYTSLEEVPEELRGVFLQAMAAKSSDLHLAAGAKLKITFNGKEYSRVEDMPDGERRAYEAIMGAVGTDGAKRIDAVPALTDPPRRPDPDTGGRTTASEDETTGSTASAGRWVFIILALIVILAAYFLVRGLGK
jgi:hypothetical protein